MWVRTAALAALVSCTVAACGKPDGQSSESAGAAPGAPAAARGPDSAQAQASSLHQLYAGQARAALAEYLDRIGDSLATTTLAAQNGDVQRLIDNAGTAYGAIASIRPHMPSAVRTNPADFSGTDGQLAATIVVNAGVIRDSYLALHLTAPGAYCLRLKSTRIGSSSNYNWEGYVLPRVLTNCPDRQALDQSKLLKAVEDKSQSSAAGDYPRTARWGDGREGNPNNVRPVMVVRCAIAWCEVMAPTTDPMPPGHAGKYARKQARIDLWHDEQRIADPGRVVSRRGTVIPVENLEALGANAFGSWKHVADVYVAEIPPREKKYWNSYIRADTQMLEIKAGNSNPKYWGEARIARSGVILNVRRDDHTGYYVAGTARWVWKDEDEDLWIRCGEGCCQVEMR